MGSANEKRRSDGSAFCYLQQFGTNLVIETALTQEL